MKAQILSKEGKAIREIDLPDCFSAPIRRDIISRVYEASRYKQPYAPFLYAGMHHSASGIIKHARRKWKTAYGYGISRVPRKLLSRRGSRFFWVGAEIASARGGREAHPPKVEEMVKKKRINKKERKLALAAAIAATASSAAVKKRYKNLNLKISLPIVFDSSLAGMKTKELKRVIRGLFGRDIDTLIIHAQNEKMKCKSFELADVKNLNVQQLASGGMPGRLVIYTENAIKELENKFSQVTGIPKNLGSLK